MKKLWSELAPYAVHGIVLMFYGIVPMYMVYLFAVAYFYPSWGGADPPWEFFAYTATGVLVFCVGGYVWDKWCPWSTAQRLARERQAEADAQKREQEEEQEQEQAQQEEQKRLNEELETWRQEWIKTRRREREGERELSSSKGKPRKH